MKVRGARSFQSKRSGGHWDRERRLNSTTLNPPTNQQQEKNGAWAPLRRRDSARVEAAFLAWEAATQQGGAAQGDDAVASATTTVLIEGNRYEVNIN